MTNLSSDNESLQVLADAISKAIGESKGDKRFIDLTKIPLICLSITGIHESLKEIKEMITRNKEDSDIQHEKFLTKESFHMQFDPFASGFRWIVMGVSGAIGIALITAFFSLILK